MSQVPRRSAPRRGRSANGHADRAALAPFAVLLAIFASSSGCGSLDPVRLAPNRPPTVTLTSGPVDTLTDSLSWIVDIAWTASDPDGRVDRFEYAVDPPSLKQASLAQAETSWVATTADHATVRFRASRSDSPLPGSTASDFHVFALRAVDDRGGVSPLVVRAFYAYTVAPDAEILSPAPGTLLPPTVGLPFRVRWRGDDPDGAGTRAPTGYRFRLVDLDQPENLIFLFDPDSLRGEAIATNWSAWSTVGGGTTSIVLGASELAASTSWLLALVAQDEAGASTPYMDLRRNLLAFQVTAAAGPRLHVSSPGLDYTTAPGALEYLETTAVEGLLAEFRWDGLASAGREISGTRWVLDPLRLDDETPRQDEASDWSHWSQWRPGPGLVQFGVLSAGQHVLYLDVRDDFAGRATLGLRITCYRAGAEELLVVDDTRLEPDKFVNDPSRRTPDVYTRPWPSASELDTFFYARGGFPWRGARNPAGALSPPGLLSGYRFDTLGTRRGLEDPAAAVGLHTLLRYRRVLWILDAQSALSTDSFGVPVPMTALRAMSAPGRVSVLWSAVQAGVQVWLAGGGTAYASLANFNQTWNDQGGPLFTFDAGELVLGRLMYDAAHVRSALAVERHAGTPRRSPAARGGWTSHGPNLDLRAPDYSRLPAMLVRRSPDTDPIPPTRLSSQGGLFYPTTTTYEYVAAPDTIVEDMSSDPAVVRVESTLDTLLEADQPQRAVPGAPVMLYYHGREHAPFVFTGFDLWNWTRSDCQALVDFVLGDIWGMTRSSPAARPARAADAKRGVRPVRARSLDPAPRGP